MKLLFLCGSLENGKDGVGDYTRRLAGELIRQGHSASIISLNDNHINRIEKTEQESDSTKISVLRLPAQLSNKERYKKAEEYINAFNPEWLSLQYVPYSFQKRGLPFDLAKQLQKIGKGRKWHVMFHELWVGYDKMISKAAVTAFLQKHLIKSTLKKLSPACIHTSLPIYKKRIEQFGYKVYPLQIFSNIKVYPCEQNKNNKIFRAAFFSQMQFNEGVVNYLTELQKQLEKINKKLIITLIGGSEKNVSVFESQLSEHLPFGIEISKTDFLSEKEISECLQQQDLGITLIPRWCLGKSGSVAAFMVHKIPVVMPRFFDKEELNEWGHFNKDVIDCFKKALNITQIVNNEVLIDEKISELFEASTVANQYILVL